MRIVDIIYSVPEILLIVVIKLVIDDPLNNLVNNVGFLHPLQKIGSGLLAIFIVYGCLYWVGMARIVRGQVLQLKQQEYVYTFINYVNWIKNLNYFKKDDEAIS